MVESANFPCTCRDFPKVEKVLSYKGAIGFGRCLPLLTFGVGAFSWNVLPEATAGEGAK